MASTQTCVTSNSMALAELVNPRTRWSPGGGGAEGGTASTQELGENLPKCEELRTLPGMQSPR